MNRLDLIKNLRLGRPWMQARRAIYEVPFDTEPGKVACWHTSAGPVFDAADLESLGWTTAEMSIRDDGALSLANPNDGPGQILIWPAIFHDATGTFHLGWPFAGYVKDEQWRFVGFVDEKPSGIDTDSHVARESIAPSSRPIRINRPIRISGTFVVRLSDDEINGLFDEVNNAAARLLCLENGKIKHANLFYLESDKIKCVRSIDTSMLIEVAVKKTPPEFAAMVRDTESATIRPDGRDFLVEFTYDLSL